MPLLVLEILGRDPTLDDSERPALAWRCCMDSTPAAMDGGAIT